MARFLRCLGGTAAFFACFGMLAGMLTSCGGKDKKNTASDEARSAGEKAFAFAEESFHVPARFLIAVAQLESQVSPAASSSLYLTHRLGPSFAETAFGKSRAELGLDPANSANDDLAQQVNAYADWLAKKTGGTLPPSPSSNQEKAAWILELAKLHRSSPNTRVLFAREMIGLLNRGFRWTDPASQTGIEFAPEKERIDIAKLKDDPRFSDGLQLELGYADVNVAKRLKYIPTPRVQQYPRGVEIIHCPFSFSACVDLQESQNAASNPFWLGAHYIIPQDPSVFEGGSFEGPVQVAWHDAPVTKFLPDGSKGYHTDKIVVMLAGSSGHLQEGKRVQVDSSWLTKWQLKRMGELVYDLCNKIADRPQPGASPVVFGDCMAIGRGTTFRVAEAKAMPFVQHHNWGDIVDFDPLIFHAYLASPGGPEGQAYFEALEKKVYPAGEEVTLNLTFDANAKDIKVERLFRCATGRLVWVSLAKKEIHDKTKLELKESFWGAGPNGNGTQFLRLKVRGSAGELRGWDQLSFALKDFEKNAGFEPEECNPSSVSFGLNVKAD